MALEARERRCEGLSMSTIGIESSLWMCEWIEGGFAVAHTVSVG